MGRQCFASNLATLVESAASLMRSPETVVLHQDAFAADYQDEGYVLLGMAIKYARLRGKEVHVIGKNRGTLGGADSLQ